MFLNIKRFCKNGSPSARLNQMNKKLENCNQAFSPLS